MLSMLRIFWKTRMSRPARGARIEISSVPVMVLISQGRAPQGARGLKFIEQGNGFLGGNNVAPRKGRED